MSCGTTVKNRQLMAYPTACFGNFTKRTCVREESRTLSLVISHSKLKNACSWQIVAFYGTVL
jgi:hypothetical protein